jgi:hypothetical protein
VHSIVGERAKEVRRHGNSPIVPAGSGDPQKER